MDNLRIWAQVERTDPDMTEKVNFGAFKFTTIDAQYQIMRATELFGPCGLGWGIRNQKYDMLVVDPADPHYNLLCFTAQLWYKLDSEDGCIDIAADIELFENTKNGWKRVSDPMKKVRTDALTKGFSWMGFSADVFLGRFDDAKYVQKLQQDKRAEIMRKERKQQRDGVELASQAQLETIQRLAGQANLAGADFASWLREQYSTSWSRLTAATAEKVIAGLQELLGQDAKAGGNDAGQDQADAETTASLELQSLPYPASEQQRQEIDKLRKRLRIKSAEFTDWLDGYGYEWKRLSDPQAKDVIEMLTQQLQDELSRAQKLSEEFEADRAAGKVPA